jgi:hypothetical protein
MNIFKPEDPRKPHNAYDVLPREVADLLHQHAQSCTIYCPKRKPEDKQAIRERAANIRRDYRSLCNSPLPRKRRAPIKHLAEKYGLSKRYIHQILNDPTPLTEEGALPDT